MSHNVELKRAEAALANVIGFFITLGLFILCYTATIVNQDAWDASIKIEQAKAAQERQSHTNQPDPHITEPKATNAETTSYRTRADG